jgi:hypothetical protein
VGIRFEINANTAGGGVGGGVVSGSLQLSGIYQVSGDYAFDFAKQVSGLYVTFSGGLYQPSGAAGGGGGTVSGWAQASGLYVTHSGGLYQSSGIFQSSGVFLTSGAYQISGIYQSSGVFQTSGLYVTTSGGLYQISGIYPVSGLFALSGTAGGGGAGVSGVVHAGEFVGSGDNSITLYTLSHGLGIVPRSISVDAGSPAARGSIDISGNASGIFVTYPVAPVSGTVRLYWIAGPTDAANIVTIGSGTVHASTFIGSGNASTTVYTLSHGIGAVPQGLVVSPMSPQARGDYDVSGNASGIFVTYPIAPASGAVKLSWLAGPSTLVAISGNLVHGAEFIGSGNNSTLLYTVSHGLGIAPNTMLVDAGSPQARGNFDVSGNASGIYVTYTSPPASGTVRLFWQAGPTSIATLNAQSGIYTLTSGSTFTGTISGTGTIVGSTIDVIDNTIALRQYSSVVFKSGSTYYAKNAAGTIISSGLVPETVIQTALTGGGTIFIADGTYDLSAGFTGFTVGTNDHVILSRAVTIRVPNGYTGVMWEFAAAITGCTLEGGVHGEQGTPARDWTWVRMYAPTSGIYANIIRNSIVENANIGIKLLIDSTTGWVNNNWFVNLKMTSCVIFVDFDYDAVWPATEATGFFDNHFLGLYCQSLVSGETTYGFKNIKHGRNTFIDCNVWDANGAQVTANFDVGSSFNMAIGGIFSYLNYSDSGTSNRLWDTWGGFVPGGNITMGSNVMKFSTDITLKRHAANTLAVRNAADSAYNDLRAEGLGGSFLRSQAGTTLATIGSNTLTMAESKDLVLGTTSGTKIATSANQRMAFYGGTPAIQQSGGLAYTMDATYTSGVQSSIQKMYNAMRTYGLLS